MENRTAVGIMPICNICDTQFPDDEAYAKHLEEKHGIKSKQPQMDLSVRDAAEARIAAKDSEIASLKKELDDTVAALGAKDAEIVGIKKELDDTVAALGAKDAEIVGIKKELADSISASEKLTADLAALQAENEKLAADLAKANKKA